MAQRVHTPTPKLLPVLGAPPRPGTPTPPMVRLGEAAIPRRWSGTGVSTRYCLPPWGKIERGRHQGCRRLSSWRRKEVALGRLSTLTVILIIGAWGAATEGAPPDDAISSPAKAARKPPPVPPIKYLEAGSRLFNSGNFELAAKYLNAAQMYRDQLQQDEQTMLDAYLKELSKVRALTAAGSTATAGAGPAMTPAAVQPAPATTGVIQSGDPARGGAGDVAITPDVKQHAVWLLHEAREQMAQGNLDAAEKKIAEAEAIDIKWGLFDDTPTKVRTDLNKERPKNLASTSKPAQSLPHNRENAHALLREARAVLANHQIDQAEAIAQEVKSWNLSYSFFGDNPDKVAAAARALRKRD